MSNQTNSIEAAVRFAVQLIVGILPLITLRHLVVATHWVTTTSAATRLQKGDFEALFCLKLGATYVAPSNVPVFVLEENEDGNISLGIYPQGDWGSGPLTDEELLASASAETEAQRPRKEAWASEAQRVFALRLYFFHVKEVQCTEVLRDLGERYGANKRLCKAARAMAAQKAIWVKAHGRKAVWPAQQALTALWAKYYAEKSVLALAYLEAEGLKERSTKARKSLSLLTRVWDDFENGVRNPSYHPLVAAYHRHYRVWTTTEVIKVIDGKKVKVREYRNHYWGKSFNSIRKDGMGSVPQFEVDLEVVEDDFKAALAAWNPATSWGHHDKTRHSEEELVEKGKEKVYHDFQTAMEVEDLRSAMEAKGRLYSPGNPLGCHYAAVNAVKLLSNLLWLLKEKHGDSDVMKTLKGQRRKAVVGALTPVVERLKALAPFRFSGKVKTYQKDSSGERIYSSFGGEKRELIYSGMFMSEEMSEFSSVLKEAGVNTSKPLGKEEILSFLDEA